MKKTIASIVFALSCSVLASGYGGYDQEPVDVFPVKITMKGDKAASCELSKASIVNKVSIDGCDYTDTESTCKCDEVKSAFSCEYKVVTTCTPDYELFY